MIQRIQTLFLFVALLGFIALFFVPVASFYGELHMLKLYLLRLENLVPGSENLFSNTFTLPLLIGNGLLALLSILIIFQYKNRGMQMRILKIAILINILLIIGVLYGYPEMIKKYTLASSEYEIGSWIPIITLVFFILANRYISKDEQLIRSMDRLR